MICKVVAIIIHSYYYMQSFTVVSCDGLISHSWNFGGHIIHIYNHEYRTVDKTQTIAIHSLTTV